MIGSDSLGAVRPTRFPISRLRFHLSETCRSSCARNASTTYVSKLEILAPFALHRAFEPTSFAAGTPVQPETATAG